MTTPDFSGMSPFHLAIEEGASNCLAEALRFMPKEIHQYPDNQVGAIKCTHTPRQQFALPL